MGEGTSRLTNGNGKVETRSPREIERDIEHLRASLDRSLAELDRRRHELTNIRLQMRKHPAVFFGTSSDRIGSPEGMQAYYVTTAKYLPFIRTAPYVTLNYSEWDEGLNIPFGANVELGAGLSIRPMYDGQRTHLLASWATSRASVTLIWAWLESAGAAVSFGF